MHVWTLTLFQPYLESQVCKEKAWYLNHWLSKCSNSILTIKHWLCLRYLCYITEEYSLYTHLQMLAWKLLNHLFLTLEDGESYMAPDSLLKEICCNYKEGERQCQSIKLISIKTGKSCLLLFTKTITNVIYIPWIS